MKKTTHITIRFSEQEKESIRKESVRRGFENLSDFIRWAIREMMKNER